MISWTAGGAGALLFSVFFFLLLLGTPIMVAMGGTAMCAFLFLGLDLSIMIERAFTSLTSFPLMALPAFVLAGALMEAGGISRRLVTVAELCAGRLPGGIAIATILACLFFGAISGSGPATTAAVGMLMIPAMARRGMNSAYAAAVAATAGGIGIVMPPSVPMVIYGVSAQVSISALFMAGIIPGILLAAVLCLYAAFTDKKEVISESELRITATLSDIFWALLAPLLVLGGIYAGWFTPTEAAVIAIFYTLLVGSFIYRELDWKRILQALNTTSWLTGRVLILVFTAQAFGFILTICRLPDAIVQWVLGFTDSPALIWLFVIILLLLLGMFMETLALIMLVTPVILPVMTAFGVDPIHFGLILICCCGIGFATPPLGENIFIASGISGVAIESICKKAVPFLAAVLLVIVALIIFPSLSLWLPGVLLG